MDLQEKLEILSASARYDVSCSSSGSSRGGKTGTLGNTLPSGICHSWADDGRCVSLLKVLFTNHCIYDCAYCLNRRSNPQKRAAFTVRELVDLTMGFYRRNYIEGLFLSSGVVKNPDFTMELLLGVVRILRVQERFNGYIHLKAIPGADQRLIRQAGLHVDRMSVNIELPSSRSLEVLAPEKKPGAIFAPMRWISDENANALELAEPRNQYLAPSRRSVPMTRGQPKFVPAGQSTQMIVGASPESDLEIIRLSSNLYKTYGLKRVYFSAYMPVNQDNRLPAVGSPPLLREHRLYQADWLMRFYKFDAEEILDAGQPHLDEAVDPKTAWALRHPEFFPVEVQTAGFEALLRVPGIGPQSAKRIWHARKHARLTEADLKKMGVVLRRAHWFIQYQGQAAPVPVQPALLRRSLSDPAYRRDLDNRQGVLF